VIEAMNLSKRYGQTLAVDGLTFTVAAGQVTGFLGPKGSAKSTATRMIVGLDAPSSGRVRIGGLSYGTLRFRCMRSAPCSMPTPCTRVGVTGRVPGSGVALRVLLCE
jgi:ABC-type multidrug transport system ATPase subunit